LTKRFCSLYLEAKERAWDRSLLCAFKFSAFLWGNGTAGARVLDELLYESAALPWLFSSGSKPRAKIVGHALPPERSAKVGRAGGRSRS
jgi:hypothetical protein